MISATSGQGTAEPRGHTVEDVPIAVRWDNSESRRVLDICSIVHPDSAMTFEDKLGSHKLESSNYSKKLGFIERTEASRLREGLTHKVQPQPTKRIESALT